MQNSGTVGKISDCHPGGLGFNPWPGGGLNFRQPFFITSSAKMQKCSSANFPSDTLCVIKLMLLQVKPEG